MLGQKSPIHSSIRHSIILSLILIFTVFPILISASSQPPVDPPGEYQGGNNQNPQESRKFEFGNNLAFQLYSQQSVNFSISYDESVSERFLGMNINNSQNLELSLYYQGSFANPPQNQIQYGGKNSPGASSISLVSTASSASIINSLSHTAPNFSDEDFLPVDSVFAFDTFYTIETEAEFIEEIEIFTYLNYSADFSQDELSDYLWVIYSEEESGWISLDTQIIDGGIQVSLSNEEIADSFTLTVVKIQTDSTIPPPDGELEGWQYFLIIGIPIIALLMGIVMTTQEYRDFLLNRVMHIDKGAHRLSIEDVLENENRNSIINLILEKPGVHFNEILREIHLSAGNLAWHLDILETFKIVRKQRVGQYLLYYPYYEQNPISKLDAKLQKSRTTLEILQMINDHPGIYQNQIAHRMDLDHKTVKYHLDKLIDADIVVFEKTGRKKNFYPSDYMDEESSA
ncbi:MAG: winged helix-turn-helix transcriptional regulator [Promethearchaeota archaeon]